MDDDDVDDDDDDVVVDDDDDDVDDDDAVLTFNVEDNVSAHRVKSNLPNASISLNLFPGFRPL